MNMDQSELTLPIFFLFGAAAFFMLLSFLLFLIDKGKQKKQKSLPFIWQIAGSAFFFLGISIAAVGAYGCALFDGTEAGERQDLLSERLSQKEVLVISSKYQADDVPFSKKSEECARIINRHLSSDAFLSYTDQFYNKKKLPLSAITSAEGDPNMSAKNMTLVQYLVTEKSGIFSMPKVHYYLIFGTQGKT